MRRKELLGEEGEGPKRENKNEIGAPTYFPKKNIAWENTYDVEMKRKIKDSRT